MKKIVLVTGGAQGIGRGIAALLSARGYEVAVADVRKVKDFAYFRCDVASESQIRGSVGKIIQTFGRLDALVNNAGLTGARSGPLEELSLKDWNRRIAVNLTGPFLMAKHCAPHLRKSRGAIVNIASTRALQSERETESYSASKAGLVGLTHAMAMTLGPAVRVNCVSPGWIAHAKVRKKDHAQHPAGRVGRDEDIAGMVAYLISDAAGFITGANFVIDGGMTRKMIYEE